MSVRPDGGLVSVTATTAATAQTITELMRTNVAGEITPRSRPDVFLKPAFSL